MLFPNILPLILNELPTYLIEVGVFEAQTKRKSKLQLNLTNAEIMFINENGSPLRNIPARPVLQMTIDWAEDSGLIERTKKKMLDVYIKTGSIDEMDKEVEKLCLRLQNYARRIIYSNDGRLAPNAPSTIKRKGDNHPLFDTGQLARSITCSYTKI